MTDKSKITIIRRGGGANCSIVTCTASKGANPGLCFAKVPKKGVNDEWRAKLLHCINRCDLRFNPDTAHICSRHFDPSCFTVGPSGRRRLIPGSIPTVNMPSKSIETPKPTERAPPRVREPPPLPVKVCYLSLKDLQKDVSHLPSPWILLEQKEDTMIALGIVENCTVKVRVNINSDLVSEVMVLGGLPVPELKCNMEGVKLRDFLHNISSLQQCQGVVSADLQHFGKIPGVAGEKFFLHVTHIFEINSPSNTTTCLRATNCKGLSVESVCKHCQDVERILRKKLTKNRQEFHKPLSINDPLHHVPPEKLKEELKGSRKRERKLKQQISQFKEQLKTETVTLTETMHDDITQILSHTELADPLTKLFWNEQKKAFKSKGPRSHKWHPMMIRLALLLHSRGPSAYNTLRDTGVLKLPGESTLRDYTNYIHPSTGFNPQVLEELEAAANKLEEKQRYVVLLHDEMSIKEDLVFDKKSGDIVGFINIEKWADCNNAQTVASHVLVFYVVGVNSNLKASMGFFGTRTAPAVDLFFMFWQAVRILEQRCNLKVIASTSDKASPNQRLCQLHGDDTSVCYKTMNYYAPEREIYFFSDVPHLIKTVRNNLLKSGPGKSMLLWKDGKEILWQHISQLYFDDISRELVRTKLTKEHIFPTGRTLMSVKLAAQVLSRSVGLVMREYGGEEKHETADFILKMDRFFDCLNGRSLEGEEATQKLKPDLKPYRDVGDPRFHFLDQFLDYLCQWKLSVDSRPGNFSKSDRAKMFLTQQTYKGLYMTIHSFKEVTHYLLNNGVDFILSNKFCQDPLEAHFGRHRCLSRRSENPNLYTFGYQENKIRQQRSLAMTIQPQGNVARKKRASKIITITTSPLKKAKH